MSDWRYILAQNRGTLLAVVLFVVMFAIYTSNHPAGFTANVVQTAANKGVLLALVAMAQTFVVITAGIDLSVGAVMVLANCLASWIVVGTAGSATLGPRKRIGIMASSRRNLKAEHLVLAGAADIPVALATMDGFPNFRAGMSGTGDLDTDKVEVEVAEVARNLVAEHPDIGAIVFECVDLPPYAYAVQQATGLPVYDITTLINHTLGALVRHRFTGVY